MKIESQPNTITATQISSVLEIHNTPGAKPVLFVGPPGLGKTTAINTFCQRNNFDSFVFMLNQFSPPDLKGYLIPNHETRRMDCYPSSEIPWSDGRPYAETHDGRRPFILLDELLSVMPGMFNLSQQLIHERRLGSNFLPPDVLIAAAANGASMKCGSSKLIMSLADRFAIYHVRPDLQSVLDWMTANRIHPWILSFIKAQSATGGGVLWSTAPDKWTGEEPIDSARSYTALSNVLYQWDDEQLRTSTLLSTVCCANIGTQSGTKLAEYIKLSIEVGNIDEMIANPAKAVIPDRPDLRWGVASRCVGASTKENFSNIIALAKRLTPPDMQPDDPSLPSVFEAFIVRAIITAKPSIIAGNQVWLDWLRQNKQYLMTESQS